MEFIGLPCLCMNDSHDYGTEFNFTYHIYNSDGLTSEEKVLLKIGENHLAVSEEKVSLTKIYTRWNSICYKINTTRKVDFRKTEIKLKTSGSKTLDTTRFMFTSEENSFGVTNNKFEDGRACIECHDIDSEDEGSAPDLTGYGSREWLIAFIENPEDQRFYGKKNDRIS